LVSVLSLFFLQPSDSFFDIGENFPDATPVEKYDLAESSRVDHWLATNYGDCYKDGLFSLSVGSPHTEPIAVKYVWWHAGNVPDFHENCPSALADSDIDRLVKYI